MIFQHKELSRDKWFRLSFLEQMANIGSEVDRALSWKTRNLDYSKGLMNRAIELLYLTIDDKKNVKRLKELTRVYEMLIDYFYFDNKYNTSEIFWKKYFFEFIYATRKNK